MKRNLALFLAVMMAFGIFAGCANTDDPVTTDDTTPTTEAPTTGGSGETEPTTEATAGGPPSEPAGQLIVGVNVMNADMFSGWSNLVGNADIKNLIYGLSTVSYTANDTFEIDPVVVKDYKAVENADGSMTYTMEINPGLKYSDGTELTAKDFVFGMLFACSPALAELECDLWTGNDVYQGAVAYHNGDTEVLSGLRLLGDYSLSMTVPAQDEDGADNFPFWYAITYASISPFPMHVLAPGCDVADDGEGAYITGPYDADLLRSTLDNGSEGYRYTPSAMSGPYMLTDYNEADGIATLEANPHFPGRYDGAKPMIKTLLFKTVAQNVAIDELRTGGIELYIQVSGGDNINAGLDLVEEGKHDYADYSRNGYGRILFHCSEGPTQFAEVRRAIAWCIDREEFNRQYTQGHGVIAQARYGAAQWMYQDNKDYLEDNLTAYTVNVDKAIEELVAGGWIYDANGGDYVEGAGNIRHKKLDDGTLMPLELNWFSPASNAIGEMLGTFLNPNAATIGMKLNQTFGEDSAFGDALYGYSETYYHMINGGVGFSTQDSPWYYYDPAMPAQYNTNMIDDVVLYESTQAMRRTETGDYDKYSAEWLKFIMRYNEILPDLPLYSDNYHDFYTTKLQGYERTALWPWYQAVITSWVSE